MHGMKRAIASHPEHHHLLLRVVNTSNKKDGDMVCFDEMDPDKAVVLVNFEGGGSAYSEDLNNVAYSHCNGLVATSR